MRRTQRVHCEISIIPIGKSGKTGMSNEVAAAFSAMQKIEGIRVVLTPMGTLIEAERIEDVLEAVRVAHKAVKSTGTKRIISSIRIDERLDKPQTLDDKIKSVEKKLKGYNRN